MAEELIRWKILANLDKTGALNSLKSLIKGLDNSVDERVQERIEEGTKNINGSKPAESPMDKGGAPDQQGGGILEGIQDTMGGATDNIKSIASGLGSGLKLLGKIGGAIMVGMGLFKALQPTFEALGSFTQMIAELLRPINDAFMMLLIPLFQMMRPIVQVFSTLMMPFRKMAMQGASSAGALMGKGMEMKMKGEEGGGALIKEGLKGALQSANLMMSGFIDVIFSPLANAMGIGDRFESAMDSWQASAMKGVTRVILLQDTFSTFASELGNDSEAVKQSMAIIDEQVSMVSQAAGGFSMDNVEGVLDAIQGTGKVTEGALTKDFEKIKEGAESLNKPASELLGNLSGAGLGASYLNDQLDDLSKSLNDTQLKQFQQGEFDAVKRDIESSEPGFLDKLGAGFGAVQHRRKLQNNMGVDPTEGFMSPESILQPFKTFKEGFSGEDEEWAENSIAKLNRIKSKHEELPTHIEKGLNTMLTRMNKYMGNSLIPESMESGLLHMYKDTGKYYGKEEGLIVKKYQGGLKNLEKSTEGFTESMKKVGKIAKDSLNKVEKWVSKYNSAMDRIEDLEKKGSNTRGGLRG